MKWLKTQLKPSLDPSHSKNIQGRFKEPTSRWLEKPVDGCWNFTHTQKEIYVCVCLYRRFIVVKNLSEIYSWLWCRRAENFHQHLPNWKNHSCFLSFSNEPPPVGWQLNHKRSFHRSRPAALTGKLGFLPSELPKPWYFEGSTGSSLLSVYNPCSRGRRKRGKEAGIAKGRERSPFPQIITRSLICEPFSKCQLMYSASYHMHHFEYVLFHTQQS